MTNLINGRPAEWTDAQIELLTKMRADGHSAAAIAKALGDKFTRSAVLGKAHRLGLPPVPRQSRDVSARVNRRAVQPQTPRRPRKVTALRVVQPPHQKGSAPVATEPFMALPGSAPVALEHRGLRGCRWPIDTDGIALCCNQDQDPDHPSYCAEHRRMSGQRGLRTADKAVVDDARRFGKFQFGRAA